MANRPGARAFFSPGLGLVVLAAVMSACASAASPAGSSTAFDTAGDGGAAPAPVEPAGARICSWNLRRLGHKFDSVDKDIATVRAVVDQSCDVLAVEEVMQTSGGHTPGYDALLAALGADWGGEITAKPRPDTTSPNSEHYAFFYRKRVADVCQGWTGGAEYVRDPNDAFLREPAWTCIKIQGRDRELLLAAYHALYGSLAERRREVALVSGDIDADGTTDDLVRAMRASRANADAVLVGDFNLTKNELQAVLPTYADLTAGNGSTLNDQDEVTTNEYDHVVVAPDEPLRADLGLAEVLDVRAMAPAGAYFKTVSDHLPIRFHLAFAAAPPVP